ncbi:MAG: LamG-like jellyroll fold domain-containing protein [Bacteroidota bacterium]|nr:LamG-like jellyroll fold domain-containing protein [Bacteroidota bacterium]
MLLSLGIKSQSYDVTTIAGTGSAGLLNGSGTPSEFHNPYGVKYDGMNSIYIADLLNQVIRKLDLTTNIVTTVAGTGAIGYQDGPCSTATFHDPSGLFYRNGVLYISDKNNNVIRAIDIANDSVYTVAGTGVSGFQDGPTNLAKFKAPGYLYVDTQGIIYVCDYENHCIRKINGSMVTTIAGVPGVAGFVNGPGNQAKFYRPADICMDANGNMYVTDIMNNVIRKIDQTYNVTTYAGNGSQSGTDGSLLTSAINRPTNIDITPSGAIYVASGAGGHTIKRISSGSVTTVAGTHNTPGSANGPGSSALFNQIQGLCFHPSGHVYIGDAYNNKIREMIIPMTDTVPLIDTTLSPECLVASYDFDGNANDMVGTNYNGSIYGATLTTDRFGNSNSAFYFDGVDDHINFPTDFDFSQRSITFWFNATTITTTLGVMFEADHNAMNNAQTEIGVKNVSGVEITSMLVGGAANKVTPQINGNNWHQLAVVRDLNEIRYYIDCQLVGTKFDMSNIVSNNGNNSFAALGMASTNDYYYNGKIDELKIYNCALSDSELIACYNPVQIEETNNNYVCGDLSSNNYLFVTNSSMESFFSLKRMKNVSHMNLFDINGKVVVNFIGNYNQFKNELEKLNAGMYFYNMDCGNSIRRGYFSILNNK